MLHKEMRAASMKKRVLFRLIGNDSSVKLNAFDLGDIGFRWLQMQALLVTYRVYTNSCQISYHLHNPIGHRISLTLHTIDNICIMVVIGQQFITNVCSVLFSQPLYWKCNFPMNRSVRPLLVGRSFIIALKGGKLHFHAPIGALVYK